MEISLSKLTNIALASTLMTVLFFVAVTSSSGEYDPWLDYNEDGYINAKDAITLGMAFGSSGDPAKNVTIAGYANINNWTFTTINPFEHWYVNIDTEGYREISVGFDPTGTVNLNVFVRWRIGGMTYLWESFTLTNNELHVYDVHGYQLYIDIYNPDPAARTVYIDYYITA